MTRLPSSLRVAGKISAVSNKASTRPEPEPRSAYPVLRAIPTRWMDNDAYGHINNVVYYSWFDTAVNAWLIENGVLDIARSSTVGLVVETHCNYFAPLAFPQTVTVGLRVAHVGATSVRYELAVFGDGALCAARGHFVHVYVDATSHRPTAVPNALIKLLETLA
jgi:acyl-CoA thioester hydrolase